MFLSLYLDDNAVVRGVGHLVTREHDIRIAMQLPAGVVETFGKGERNHRQ